MEAVRKLVPTTDTLLAALVFVGIIGIGLVLDAQYAYPLDTIGRWLVLLPMILSIPVVIFLERNAGIIGRSDPTHLRIIIRIALTICAYYLLLLPAFALLNVQSNYFSLGLLGSTCVLALLFSFPKETLRVFDLCLGEYFHVRPIRLGGAMILVFLLAPVTLGHVLENRFVNETTTVEAIDEARSSQPIAISRIQWALDDHGARVLNVYTRDKSSVYVFSGDLTAVFENEYRRPAVFTRNDLYVVTWNNSEVVHGNDNTKRFSVTGFTEYIDPRRL